MMDELFQKMCISATESIEQMVAARVTKMLDKYFRSEIKLIYGEKEAAAFLGVSVSTLAAWRKRGVIAYAQYPQAKADDLSDMFTYSIADMLNFRERYIRRALNGANVYEIGRTVSVMGPEIKQAA